MSTDDMNTPISPDDDAVPLLDRTLYRAIKKMDRNTLRMNLDLILLPVALFPSCLKNCRFRLAIIL